MKHLDIFSGIGGFALAAQTVWSNHQVVAFCDYDPFCQAVLAKHWPGVPIYDNIYSLTAKRHWGNSPGTVDILTGGFPCQPFSSAGEQRGILDNRYLWPQMLRIVREFKPRWVIAENVRGLLTQDGGLEFEQVCSDLERAGYEVQAFLIPACAVGACHIRQRLWFLAYAHDGSRSVRQRQSPPQSRTIRAYEPFSPQSEPCRMADGVPNRAHRIKALGNAIVPQVAAQIFLAISKADPLLPESFDLELTAKDITNGNT